ncbi:sodium:phosphate symporter [Moraxella caviae]|nr:sodium:phosphate symporter [Moraxella caviae]
MNFANHTKRYLNYLVLPLFAIGLGFSFWYSEAWLALCYGLALFLFGMQCIEEGLHSAAGGTLERLMSKSTATPFKGFLFGIGSTFVLQSSTLVSLLTIAFLSTGMITLAGGIAIIFGTNLGATTGIWLLALAGQSVSLSPIAIPMLVFGVLVGFFGGQAKAIGRILIGVALIFLGIDAIKAGFGGFGEQIDFASLQFDGATQVLIFAGVGFLLTCVLQSSHATLILTLAALASSQITITQGFAIAVGSNLGSSATTAIMGMIGSERSGQRLALVHLFFNAVTALLSFVLWLPFTALVAWIAKMTNMSVLMQLALFHSLFNIVGVMAFWRWQERLAALLVRILPDKSNIALLPDGSQAVLPRHLDANALLSSDIAMRAVSKEIRHLSTLSMEVMCHAIFVPTSALHQKTDTLPKPKLPLELDVQALYEWQIKPLYGEILDFTSKMDVDEADSRSDELTAIHMVAFAMMGMVKDGKHLQKNMSHALADEASVVYGEYSELRAHTFGSLAYLSQAGNLALDSNNWHKHIDEFSTHIERTEAMRHRLLQRLRDDELDNLHVSSLMNDINYARRIDLSIFEMLTSAGEMFCYKAK